MSVVVQQPFSAFDPRSVSGCQLWLDGRDPAGTGIAPSTGASVTTWVDKSGSSANGTSVGTTPTFASGGGLTFSSGAYNTSYSASLSNETLFVVHRFTGATSTGQATLVGQTADGGRLLDIEPTNRRISTSSYFVAYSQQSPINVITNDAIAIGGLVTVNSAMGVYYNGTSYGGGTPVTITAGRTSVIGGAYKTGALNSTQFFLGVIYEVIGFTRALSTIERRLVEGYLGWKWGLQTSLPATHPNYYTPLATRPFQPPDAGALSLWLDAADRSTVTLTSTSVTAWKDKSSNAYSFTGAVGGYPTYSNTIGGLPVVSSATGQRLSNTTWRTPSTTATMFVVIKPSALANNASCLLTDSPSGQVGFKTYYSYANQGGYYYYFQMFGAQTTSSGAFLFQSSLSNSAVFTPTQTVLISVNIQGGPAHTVRYNGVQTAANVLNDARSLVAASGVTLVVAGAADTASSAYDLAEFIMYDGTMTTEQTKQVEGYLATKWRISTNIPTTEPYYNMRTLPDTALFSPVNLSNCGLWLDAADRTTVTGTTSVTAWNDKSGLGSNLSNVGTSTYVSSSYININPSLPAAGYLLNTGLNLGTSLTLFAVYLQTSATGALYTTNAGDVNGFFPNEGGTTYLARSDSAWYTQTSTIPLNQVNMVVVQYDGTNIFVWLNGTLNITSTTTGTITRDRFVLGARVSGSNFLPGRMYEVTNYNRSLSTIERQQVEGYLSWKWGLQTLLPTSHPFKKFRA
jgi:hypothetical protein